MTTEFVLLLGAVLLIAFVMIKSLNGTFEKSGPRLGARIEKHTETGSGFALSFKDKDGWMQPSKRQGN